MRYEIRGIIRQSDEFGEITRNVLLLDEQRCYIKLELALSLPFNQDLVISSCVQQLKIDPDDLTWPKNVEIPKL